MNAERRKSIAEAADLLGQAKTLLEVVRDDELGAFDNLPEGLQASEPGEKIQAAAELLDEVLDSLEAIEEQLEEAAA